MCSLSEIGFALDTIISSGTDKKNITVLHCNSEYPTPFEDVNLKAMLTIKDEFEVKIGYSDHTLGIEVPIAAVALGAEVIEKHFTLNRKLDGPDHKASLEPIELNEMVKAIRNITKSIGSSIKKPSESEMKNIQIARKSIIANDDIKVGDLFTENNLIIKRPGNGLNPKFWDDIIGTESSHNYKKDDLINNNENL